jgi:hypothetical protein
MSASANTLPKFPPYVGLGGKLAHYVLLAFCVGALVFLMAPVLVVVPLAFNAEPFFTYPIHHFSLKWFHEFLTNETWQTAGRQLSGRLWITATRAGRQRDRRVQVCSAPSPRATRNSSNCSNVSGIASSIPVDGHVERLLRQIELAHHQQRLAFLLLEGHGRDGAVVAFLVGPDEASIRHHFEVPAGERHGRRGLG